MIFYRIALEINLSKEEQLCSINQKVQDTAKRVTI